MNETTNMLIVGDGNFSFSVAFARSLESSNKQVDDLNCLEDGCNDKIKSLGLGLLADKGQKISRASSIHIYATSYDSESVIKQNENSWANVQMLKDMSHVSVYHEIDATKLDSHFEFKIFDKIIFNFPHVGGKSNINACRNLLSRFFQSAVSCISTNSKVVVSLCKGQGGTPRDSGRNGYGNSWQIVTQAAKAGLVLNEIQPFGARDTIDYKTAGYRGQLAKGFHKEGSLTHVFIKGNTIGALIGNQHFSSGSLSDSPSFIKKAEEFYVGQLKSKDPYNDECHPFSMVIQTLKEKLDSVFSSVEFQLENGFQGTCSELLEFALNDMSLCNKKGKETVRENIPYSAKDHSKKNWEPKESLDHLANTSPLPVCFTKTFVNPTMEISPNSYVIYKEMVLLASYEEFKSLDQLVEKITKLIQTITTRPVRAAILNHAESKLVNKSSSANLDPAKDFQYDPSKVPNFLSDINMNSWLNLSPEVTISGEQRIDFGINAAKCDNQNDKVLKYRNIHYNDYALNEREEKYFASLQHLTFMQCFENQDSIGIYINDVLVAKCGVEQPKTKCTSLSDTRKGYYTVVFRIDHLCMAVLQVEDMRLFWSADYLYLEKLKNQMTGLLQHLDVERPSPTSLFPLCYRHDLCFWLSELASEQTLLTALRYLADGAIHSVRLLRILRHEETDLISYCYRIIYSRCDGPLSHKESVALQNQIRLTLLDLKFQLR